MVDVDDKNEWKECIDIGGVRLPTGYFFGASAATGDLSGGSVLQSCTLTINKNKVITFLCIVQDCIPVIAFYYRLLQIC